MELAHSLLLNETVLQQIPDARRGMFVFEWLRFLDKILLAANKNDIKDKQKALVDQLTGQIHRSPGPPTRVLLARNVSVLFSIGDPGELFNTLNVFNDAIKSKDDSPSYLPCRLAAIKCLGCLYQRLGRMTGNSFQETIQNLIKSLRNSESQVRAETMVCLSHIVTGLGSAATSTHRDIFRETRKGLTDRASHVRVASATCLSALVDESALLKTTELVMAVNACIKAFDNSTYDVRFAVSKVLGKLLAAAVAVKVTAPLTKNRTRFTEEDALVLLSNGFLRGGSGFIKSDMLTGGGQVSRELRVGVTEAYVGFVTHLGTRWLERNISLVVTQVLDVSSLAKATQTHVEAVYTRKCVCFILESLFVRLLGEKAQAEVVKELSTAVRKHMNSLADESQPEATSSETSSKQHLLVCALHTISLLVVGLSTGVLQLVQDTLLVDAVFAVLLHPALAARLAAAWTIRCIAIATPSQLTPLVERCIKRLSSLKASPVAVSGYSAAMAALTGVIRLCPLGTPQATGKHVFVCGEDLLRTASQNSRLSLPKTQAGWLILGSLMTVEPAMLRHHLPRMLYLWKNAFPKSQKDLDLERSRNDSFSWQVTLESRSGALCSIRAFIFHSPELITDDVKRRLSSPLESAVSLASILPEVVKSHGGHLKASAVMFRLRLYEVLTLLPTHVYESSFNVLLRELVAEFTLTDNATNTTTSLLRSICHRNDSVILGSWLDETDQSSVEEQLQTNSASGSGALEHDPSSLYNGARTGAVPGPLPLGVAVLDVSVTLFGQVFPHVANKHRLQMLQHFTDCIKQSKSSRQQAMQTNIFTAVLSALKGLADSKNDLGPPEVRKAANTLVLGALANNNPILRCAAGEAVGRMAQVVGDHTFVALTAQSSFDRLKSLRDVVSRTGNSLALGCLHRYVGGMGSGQHLATSISILLALAQDVSSPVVQVWAIHALALIADSGGPMFRTYVEPTLALVVSLLLTIPSMNVDVHQCLGRCLAALITTLGPELQANSGHIANARSSCLVGCAIMLDHEDYLVQVEAIICLQQIHVFAPRHVNLSRLMPHLIRGLVSGHLLLRRAVIGCLRQFVQRESTQLLVHTNPLLPPNTTFVEYLFNMLDSEYDELMLKDVRETLTSLLITLNEENGLANSLGPLSTVLGAAVKSVGKLEPGETEYPEDDASAFRTWKPDDTSEYDPRWRTKLFAMEMAVSLIDRDDEPSNSDEKLVVHVGELVKMAFMAATSHRDNLKLAGLVALQRIISVFSRIRDPLFPECSVLEQYQAQVGAALRPVFVPDTPANVTAKACHVWSSWIASEVISDLGNLRRVHQLLVTGLSRVQVGNRGQSSELYSEIAATVEKLAVLKAWAEVYVVAVKQTSGVDQTEERLLDLVRPELKLLSRHWLSALRDYTLMSFPAEFVGSNDGGGAFFSVETAESSREHFEDVWAPILQAVSVWLVNGGFESAEREKADFHKQMPSVLHSGYPLPPAIIAMTADQISEDRFSMLLGIAVQAMSSQKEGLDKLILCIDGMIQLTGHALPCKRLKGNTRITVELLNVLHRLVLTRDSDVLHSQVVQLTVRLVDIYRDVRTESNGDPSVSEDSFVFATLEVVICLLFRRIPTLNFALNGSVASFPMKRLTNESVKMAVVFLKVLPRLLEMSPPGASVAYLPTVLHVVCGVIKQSAQCVVVGKIPAIVVACIAVMEDILASKFVDDDSAVKDDWLLLLKSSYITLVKYRQEGHIDSACCCSILALIMRHAPKELLDDKTVMETASDLFQQAWQDGDDLVKVCCAEKLVIIFREVPRVPALTLFVHEMTPFVVMYIQSQPEPSVVAVISSLDVVYTLVDIAEEEKRPPLLSLLLPLLVSFLKDGDGAVGSVRDPDALHNSCMERLKKIGMLYPVHFKAVMTTNSHLKSRLERAIKASQSTFVSQPRSVVKQSVKSATPSITLKMNFSGYA